MAKESVKILREKVDARQFIISTKRCYVDTSSYYQYW